MKLTYGNQTIDLFPESDFPDGPPENIIINVSGGLDSAALLYLMCTNYPNVKKHIFTGHDPNCPFDSERARDVVDWCQNNIEGHNILTHDVIPYDDKSDAILNEVEGFVEKDPSLYDKYPWIDLGDEEESRRSFLGKIAKPYYIMKLLRELLSKYNCTRYMAAMTQNPPNKDMEELGFAYLAETKRNEDRDDVHILGVCSYHPLARVNKKFVRGVYDTHGLDDYYELTGSCTGNPIDTKGFMEPCKKCFWCHEKHWAFGKY